MNLAALLDTLPPTGLGTLPFPPQLLGAFRRKSITFCTGLTDETTTVYWFQSRTFTIDLRLPEGNATPLADRQGWIGDSVWDQTARQLSWDIRGSYQPRLQWPEAASFAFIGNSVIEFAPSGAYVEDWRQQSSVGPFLGLRLVEMRNDKTGEVVAVEGGLILAGEHVAFARSRLPFVDEALRDMLDLGQALHDRIVTSEQIESCDVSIAIGGDAVTIGTRPDRIGTPIASGCFEIERDGSVVMPQGIGDGSYRLRFVLDHYVPDFTFTQQTATTPQALAWMRQETDHLMRHALIHR